jgi:general secretion pathway protein N
MSGLKPFRSAAVTPGPRVTARAPSPWSWAWAGAALGLAVSLTLNAPARWLTNVLQQATQGRLVFQDPRGTLWNGSAQLVLTGGVGSTDSAALPGRFTWQLHPSVSGLQADAQADCCMQAPLRLSLTPRWGGAQLVLADSLSRWPAQWLTGLGTPWNTVQPEGNLTLATRALTGGLATAVCRRSYRSARPRSGFVQPSESDRAAHWSPIRYYCRLTL